MTSAARDFLEPVRVFTPSHLLADAVPVLTQGMPAFVRGDPWGAVLPRHAIGHAVGRRLEELPSVEVEIVAPSTPLARLRDARAAGGYLLVVGGGTALGQIRCASLPATVSGTELRAIAHDLNNALQLLAVLASGEGPSDPTIEAAFDHAVRLVGRLANLAGPDVDPPALLDVVAICEEAIAWLQPSLSPHQLDFSADSDHLLARGHRAAVERILINLVLNAQAAVGHGGTVSVAVHRNEHLVLIDVTDDGPGVPAHLRNRLFEVGVSSHEEPQRGVGLAAARTLAKKMRGELRLLRTSSLGTTLRLELPAARRV